MSDENCHRKTVTCILSFSKTSSNICLCTIVVVYNRSALCTVRLPCNVVTCVASAFVRISHTHLLGRGGSLHALHRRRPPPPFSFQLAYKFRGFFLPSPISNNNHERCHCHEVCPFATFRPSAPIDPPTVLCSVHAPYRPSFVRTNVWRACPFRFDIFSER